MIACLTLYANSRRVFNLNGVKHDFNSKRSSKICVEYAVQSRMVSCDQTPCRLKLVKMAGSLAQIFEMERMRRQGFRVFRDNSNLVEEYDDTQFLQRFRISPPTFTSTSTSTISYFISVSPIRSSSVKFSLRRLSCIVSWFGVNEVMILELRIILRVRSMRHFDRIPR